MQDLASAVLKTHCLILDVEGKYGTGYQTRMKL